MKRLLVLFLVAVGAVSCAQQHRGARSPSGTRSATSAASAEPISTPAPGARCKLRGHGEFTAPDPRCTPGATLHGLPLTRAFVCNHRDRAPIPHGVYVKVKEAYGFPPDASGELDHLIQHSFDGADWQDYNGDGLPDNLWFEPGIVHLHGGLNQKDLLEAYAPDNRSLYDRVCSRAPGSPGALTLRQAVRADIWWRRAYKKYVG